MTVLTCVSALKGDSNWIINDQSMEAQTVTLEFVADQYGRSSVDIFSAKYYELPAPGCVSIIGKDAYATDIQVLKEKSAAARIGSVSNSKTIARIGKRLRKAEDDSWHMDDYSFEDARAILKACGVDPSTMTDIYESDESTLFSNALAPKGIDAIVRGRYDRSYGRVIYYGCRALDRTGRELFCIVDAHKCGSLIDLPSGFLKGLSSDELFNAPAQRVITPRYDNRVYISIGYDASDYDDMVNGEYSE